MYIIPLIQNLIEHRIIMAVNNKYTHTTYCMMYQ